MSRVFSSAYPSSFFTVFIDILAMYILGLCDEPPFLAFVKLTVDTVSSTKAMSTQWGKMLNWHQNGINS